jgi:hypothetical protein
MTGKGIMRYANGDIYEGDWLDHELHGYGTFTFSDGRKYIGEYDNGKK